MSSVVTSSIDGMDATGAIVTFYDGRIYVNDEDRKIQIEDGKLEPDAPDYRTVPFLKIKYPGRSDLVVDRPAHLEGGGEFVADQDRYPAAWAAYRDKTAPAVGTSLELLDKLNQGDIDMLADRGIRTVETLENLTDHQLAGGMGMRRYRDVARAWRAAQPLEVTDPRAAAEIEELRAQNAALLARFEEFINPTASKPAAKKVVENV